MVKGILRDAVGATGKAVAERLAGRDKPTRTDAGDQQPTAPPATKAATKKAAAKKSTPVAEGGADRTTTTSAAKKTAAKKSSAATGAKAATRKATAPKPTEGAATRAPAARKSPPAEEAPAAQEAPPAEQSPLPFKPDEEPWTAAEVAQQREALGQERARLVTDVSDADAQLAEMLRDATGAASEDQADAGTRTFEREQGLSLAANAMEMLDQVDKALRRLDDGTYGYCESCLEPIGKVRLQAFPRATLCLTCKARQERR